MKVYMRNDTSFNFKFRRNLEAINIRNAHKYLSRSGRLNS